MRKTLALAFAVLTLAACSPGQAPAPPKAKRQGTESVAKPNPPGGERVLVASDVQAMIRKAQAEHDQGNANENVDINRGIGTFTGLLVLVSLIGNGILLWYAWLTRQAANAAMKSADTADLALRQAQRAFIVVESVTGVATPSASILFRLKNTGQTPAMNITTNAWRSSDEQLPPVPDYRGTTTGLRAIVPTGGFIEHEVRVDRRVIGPEKWTYCEVRYNDIFRVAHIYRCVAIRTEDRHSGFVLCGSSNPAYDYAD